MAPYEYVRGLDPAFGWYDIGYNDPDAGRIEPPLGTEVQAAIGLMPLVRCSGTLCTLLFDEELTQEQESSTADVVAAHKAAAYPVE